MPRLAYRFRLGTLAALLLALPFAGRADEAKKPADNSITENRKELDALRADRLLAPAPEKLGLTSGMDLSLPSMAGPSAPVPMAKADEKDPPKTPAKSAGWLLDGMEKERIRNAAARDAAKSGKLGEADQPDRRETENSRAISKDRIAADDDRSRTHGRDSDRPRELKPREKAPNPLTGYMATWMTPGDFSLLQKPPSIGGGGLLTPLSDFTSPGTPGFNQGASGGVAVTPDFAPAPSVPLENPYVRALTAPAPAAGGGMMAMAPRQPGEPALAPLAAAPPWRSAPPPEHPRANALIPENLKPSSDTKYFPQLKRF